MTTRPLHPLAWWAWAVLVGAAAIRTTNPLLLGLLITAAWVVVAARRRDVPWSHSFGRFLRLGLFVLAVRLVLQVAFAPRIPGHVLFSLPEAELPSWAAGVGVGGPVTAEAILTACYESLRLIALLAAAGAANSLADPHRLLRALPSSLHEAGVAVTVALSLAPQAGVAAAQVRDARRLRGRPTKGLAAVRGVALPVLEGALERSVAMAASMDARGFGRTGTAVDGDGDARRHRSARAAAALGFVALGAGLYGMLDAASPAGLGVPMLVAGSALLAFATVTGRSRTRRTRYRPDPWRGPEWLTVASGVAVLAGLVVAGRLGADLGGNVSPLGFPTLPLLPAMAMLVTALPAFVPEPRP